MSTQSKSCPFCGGSHFNYGESEDWGFIFCKTCNASVSIPLEELPNYYEQNQPLDCCDEETKQPLIDAWNMRHDGWISVEDRLPEKSDFRPIDPRYPAPTENWVLISTSLGKVQVSKYTGLGWCNIRFSQEHVTHWMPLPEPLAGADQ